MAQRISKATWDEVYKALGMAYTVIDSPKWRRIRKEAASGNPVIRTDNETANNAYRASLLAQAESEDNQARLREQRAEEAEQTAMRSSARDVIDNAFQRAAEHRAHAELHRERARAHRAAAAAYQAR
jgi:hypothetical protein